MLKVTDQQYLRYARRLLNTIYQAPKEDIGKFIPSVEHLKKQTNCIIRTAMLLEIQLLMNQKLRGK